MHSDIAQILANFTTPEHIGVNPYTLLWMLPLLIGISLVYKTTKLKFIFWKKLIKETLILLSTSVVFIVLAALAIWGFIEVCN